jgi:broad specificity phosphatase PhoE
MAVVRIARHGETTWNAVGRYQGRLDTPLSKLGEAQAEALADALEDCGIRRIISSPLTRCVTTASPLAARIGIAVHTDPLLIEIAHGNWEGRYRDEIAASEPERFRLWREQPQLVQFDGGESVADVMNRWKRFVASFEPVEDTLIVTHDIVVRVAILERSGRGPADLRSVRALNGAYAEYETDGDRWRLISECVGGHLKGLKADPDTQAL